MAIDVREVLLNELEALIEARAKRRMKREGTTSEDSLRSALHYEANDLTYVLWKLLDEHQGR